MKKTKKLQKNKTKKALKESSSKNKEYNKKKINKKTAEKKKKIKSKNWLVGSIIYSSFLLILEIFNSFFT